MRIKPVLTALALALALGGVASADVAPPPTPAPAPPASDAALDAAIDGVERFYRTVTDFKADFSQEVRRAHLPRPLKKSGKVYYKAPGKMRWDYTQPERVYYVSDGDVLWSYEQETRQSIKMRVRDSELYDSLKFLFGQGDLRASFEISAAPPQGDLVGLKLVPREGQSGYKSLTLHADPKTWEIQRSELVDPLDNVSVITFRDLTYEPLKDEGFDFKPPKGATIQDLTGGSDGEPSDR